MGKKQWTVLGVAALFIVLAVGYKMDLFRWGGEDNGLNQPDIPSDSGQYLTVVYPQIGAPNADMHLIQEEINKLTQEIIHKEVRFIGINILNYEQQSRLLLASAAKVDLLVTGTIGGMDYVEQLSNRQLLNLSGLIQQYGQGIIRSLGDFLEPGKVKGNIFGVPTLRDEAKGAGFAIRKDLVEKYRINLSDIRTIQDIEPVLKVIRDNEPELAPFYPSQEAVTGIDYAMRIPGGDMLGSDYYFSGVLMNALDRNLKVVNYYETPEYESLIKLVREWKLKGYIMPEAVLNDESAYTLVRTGRVAAFLQDIKPGIESQISKQCATEMVVVPLAPVISHTAAVTNLMWAIPAHSKLSVEAMQLLNMMYSDSRLVNLLDWGIEGKHYVKREDGRIEYPEGIDAGNTGYGTNEGYIFGNQMLSYVWKDDPVDLWKQLDVFNKSSVKSEAFGFLFDVTPVLSEFAACRNVWQQYQKALGVGAVDPEAVLPEFLEKLRAAGVDRIVDEKQRQLDQWVKEKGRP